jgi:hypothetical protein
LEDVEDAKITKLRPFDATDMIDMIGPEYEHLSFQTREAIARGICEEHGTFNKGVCPNDRKNIPIFKYYDFVHNFRSRDRRDDKIGRQFENDGLKGFCASIKSKEDCNTIGDKKDDLGFSNPACRWRAKHSLGPRCARQATTVMDDPQITSFAYDELSSPGTDSREKYDSYKQTPLTVKKKTINGIEGYFSAPMGECLKSDHPPIVKLSDLPGQLKTDCMLERSHNHYVGLVWPGKESDDPLVVLKSVGLWDTDKRGVCDDDADCLDGFECKSVGGPTMCTKNSHTFVATSVCASTVDDVSMGDDNNTLNIVIDTLNEPTIDPFSFNAR